MTVVNLKCASVVKETVNEAVVNVKWDFVVKDLNDCNEFEMGLCCEGDRCEGDCFLNDCSEFEMGLCCEGDCCEGDCVVKWL